MKYILIIWVCSFIQGNACMDPIQYPKLYDSWYECSRAAHKESAKLLAKMGYKEVNEGYLGTRYTCQPTEVY